jgi:DNA-binding transcriptional regulator YiaG
MTRTPSYYGLICKKIRLKVGYTQERFAHKLHCSPRTVQRIESGETQGPSFAIRNALQYMHNCCYPIPMEPIDIAQIREE